MYIFLLNFKLFTPLKKKFILINQLYSKKIYIIIRDIKNIKYILNNKLLVIFKITFANILKKKYILNHNITLITQGNMIFLKGIFNKPAINKIKGLIGLINLPNKIVKNMYLLNKKNTFLLLGEYFNNQFLIVYKYFTEKHLPI